MLCLQLVPKAFNGTFLKLQLRNACSGNRRGRARELILDDSYGTIIRSMASDEVVSALCRLFDDRKLLSLQSRNSRALVENRYNWDATAMDVEKAFCIC